MTNEQKQIILTATFGDGTLEAIGTFSNDFVPSILEYKKGLFVIFEDNNAIVLNGGYYGKFYKDLPSDIKTDNFGLQAIPTVIIKEDVILPINDKHNLLSKLIEI